MSDDKEKSPVEITEYQIIAMTSTVELESEVNAALSLGWQPLGGVSEEKAMNRVMQAMVRFGKLEE